MGREGQGGVIITLESFVRKDLDQVDFLAMETQVVGKRV